MGKTNNVVPEGLATSAPKENTTEQIPRLLVLGLIALFIVFLIASVALAIWLPKFAWIPLVLFLFVFSSTALIYFFIRINRGIAKKKEEDIKSLRNGEAGFLELVRIKISDTIHKQAEGRHG